MLNLIISRYKRPAPAPAIAISAGDARVRADIPTKVPAKITAAREGIETKAAIPAPASPMKQEAVTADKPYRCSRNVAAAPPAPQRIIKMSRILGCFLHIP